MIIFFNIYLYIIVYIGVVYKVYTTLLYYVYKLSSWNKVIQLSIIPTTWQLDWKKEEEEQKKILRIK